LALYYDENDNLFHCEYSSAIPWTLAPYNGVYNLLIAGVAD
jgi:hypothetical protein